MNKAILNTVIQEFINNNLEENVTSLLLKRKLFEGVETKKLVEQIEAKKKCKTKLPTWFNTENIYYPNKLNIEQTSSEITAQYKSSLIDGKSIIDLTGGFGVDCFYFSKSFNEVTHCEINDKLSNIVSHNYNLLQLSNIKTASADGINYLKDSNKNYDWIYVDPSRRHDSKGKVFYLKDCLPNIPEHLDLLFQHSNNVLIKASPMLDISIGISELKFVNEIHIIAVNNDVKELLFTLIKGYVGIIHIKTINFKNDTTELFDFNYDEEKENIASFNSVQNYLYEPNAAILKAGAFKTISQKLNIDKLHQHSHLYTSTKLINFPGRKFKVEDIITYNKKLINKMFKGKRANISTRNFPETAPQLKKKNSIKDGGDTYLFFTTDNKGDKIVIVCKKVQNWYAFSNQNSLK